jgi:senataxin
VRHVRKLFAESLGVPLATKIEVNSVDGFQGREKAVILFSTVRSDFARDFARGIGFVKDERRINVSMTRAQHSLFILGHAQTLAEVPIWARLLTDARERKCLLKATSPLSIWFETAAAEVVPLPASAAPDGMTESQGADAEAASAGPTGNGSGSRPTRRAKR